MFSDKSVWDQACELARSGEFANVIMIEREMRRRGILSGQEVTANVFKRELLTRVCHAARLGGNAMFAFDRPQPMLSP